MANTPNSSYSTPGNSAAQNQFPQGNNSIYSPNSNVDPNMPYSDISSQLMEKNFNQNLRMRVEIPSLNKAFNAHLDPNHYQHSQEKRYVKKDSQTGVVLQDFGWKEETVEIKGTTGLAFYREIQTMDDIFNNQLQGMQTIVRLKIEDLDCQAYWTNFDYSRDVNAQAGNLVEYSMQFIIISHTPSAGNDSALSASSVAQGMANSMGPNPSSTRDIKLAGQSINDYIASLKISMSQTNNALQFIQANYSSSKNNGLAFPNPDTKPPSKKPITITVPWDWSQYLTDSQPQAPVNVNF